MTLQQQTIVAERKTVTVEKILAVKISHSKKLYSEAAKIANTRENEPLNAEESSSSSSSPDTEPESNPNIAAKAELIEGDIRGDSAAHNRIAVFETTDLHSAPSGFVDTGGGDYPPIQSFEDAKCICLLETSKLWAIAAPIMFTILCNYGVNSTTNIYVGHIGDIELSAVAISLSVIANFSFGFLLGMGSALETLCGQAFGAGQIDLLGVYMQRSWIILFVACLCLLPLYLSATPILKLLGQENDIAELAGRFTIRVIPHMFSLAVNFPTQKFLQAQSKVGALAWIGFGALTVHVGMLYLFLGVFKWGLDGAAAAYDVSGWGTALAQLAYVVGWCKDGWTGLSWLAFRDLWEFTKLSIASAVMICLEIWYFMTIIVLTGHLEDPIIAVGSLSICMNINGWEGMLFIGLNAAISVRVANELGSSHPRAAKYSVIITCVQSLCIGITFACIIMITRNEFSIIFTDSLVMRTAVSKLAYLLGITMILNSIQPIISGVAVGGGWQASVAYINLFCYYAVGLPLGFLLGYKTRLHVQGIWMGMIIGTFLQTLILIYIIFRTNWNKEVKEASERMKKWGAYEEPSASY
ncbi:protein DETOXIFICATION 34 [Mercurialis annua]|uniref:protein DETOXIFICATION 34 n=1 Tax=Mercurialis annua TaxID=3986 RepID=UPI0021610214|nr:protein DETOXIFICATION 34 [Mercurialis annua]